MSGIAGQQGTGSIPPYNPGAGDFTVQTQDACKAEVEAGVVMRVDVFPEKKHFPPPNNTQPLYLAKENKEWILIKQNAGLPAWKIERGYGHCRFSDPLQQIPSTIPQNQWKEYCLANDGEWVGETEKIGKTVGDEKDVYIGLGHCSGTPGETCLDPLVQDALFVLEEAGKQWNEIAGEEVCHPWPKPKSEECSQVPGFWWKFSVYLDREAFAEPGNPKYEGLPCWAKLACAGDLSTDGGRRRREAMEECLVGETSAALTTTGDAEDRSSELLTAESFQEGMVVAVVTAQPTLTPTPTWKGGSTLKLATFDPIPQKFAYEWWTPACKPAIYLYPEKPTRLSVKVEPEGELTKTIPEHGEEGWEVIAFPGGRIEDMTYKSNRSYKTYKYLFYEAKIEKLRVSQQGWVVAKEELPGFFDMVLGRLGLIEREIIDFKEYWVRKLTEAPYYFVGLIDRDELDRVETIGFSQKPDSFIRVRFVFEKLAAPMSVEPPILAAAREREGFVAVDWGGILVDGNCEDMIVENQKIE